MNHTIITGNTAVDNASAIVSTAAITSPVWLPWLHMASDGAALVAPLLGSIWLVIQIIAKVKELISKRSDKN